MAWGFILKLVKVFVCIAHCRATTVGTVYQKIYVQSTIKNLHKNSGKQVEYRTYSLKLGKNPISKNQPIVRFTLLIRLTTLNVMHISKDEALPNLNII
ncbi:hypothetical protein T12_11735 [Trichinella patagoniensis]|uniref:Secreted protein n=1 Tax=Trichinella patagoniensis TaxID=990121 RepID=A0A0V0ZCP5_9BILA|nr:hypothetical protein T12_11735 [Trichinella patagoniensis]